MRRLLDQKDAAGAAKVVPATFSLVDRAAKWGIIKKNTAARYKSRLTLRLRSLTAKAKTSARRGQRPVETGSFCSFIFKIFEMQDPAKAGRDGTGAPFPLDR